MRVDHGRESSSGQLVYSTNFLHSSCVMNMTVFHCLYKCNHGTFPYSYVD